MALGNDEILEFAVGLQKDPSFDRLLATLPKDVKKKLGGGFDTTFDGIYQKGIATLKRLGSFAAGALGIGGIAGLGMRVGQVADIEIATKRLGRAADLTAEQEDALGRAVADSAEDFGIARADQIAALQQLQDQYAVVHDLASEGTLVQQLELATKMSNAFGAELNEVMGLMGSLNKLAGVTGDDLVDAMAFLESASKQGSMGFKELQAALPELLGQTKSLGQGGIESVRTVAAMLETVSAFYPDSMERTRTYTRQAIAVLSRAQVQDNLQKQLGVTIDNTKTLKENIFGVMDALSGLDDPTRAMYQIFGSEEAVNAWKALLTERGTFENIITVESGTKGFMDFLNDQNEETASKMKQLKEQFIGLIDETLLTEEGMEALGEILDNLGMSVEGTSFALQAASEFWMGLLDKLEVPEWMERLGFVDEGGKAKEAAEMTQAEQQARRIMGGYAIAGPGTAMSPESKEFEDWLANSEYAGLAEKLLPEGNLRTKYMKKTLKTSFNIGDETYSEMAKAYAEHLEKQGKAPGQGAALSGDALRPLADSLDKLNATLKKQKIDVTVTLPGAADAPPAETSVFGE